MTVGCPRASCVGASWSATGQAFLSRRGNVRVGIRCDHCGAVFSSVLPEAVEAARVLVEARGERMPVAVPRDEPTPFVPVRTRKVVERPTLGASKADLDRLLNRLGIKPPPRLDF